MAWECVCADAEQVEDVWVHTEEAAGLAWVMARLDGDQACVVRKEADEAHREADTARAGPATVGGVEDGAENRAGTMGTGIIGADTGIVIDPCEYAKKTVVSNPAGSAQRSGWLFSGRDEAEGGVF